MSNFAIIELIETILLAVACVVMFTRVVNNMPDRYAWPLKVKKRVLRITYVLAAISIMCMITVGIKFMV